ncbi:MAG: ornithine cyclodeaminase [Planctomycetota bacterium]
MRLLVLDAASLREALPMPDAIQAMKDGFGALAAGEAVAPQRAAIGMEDLGATTLLMGAHVPTMGLATKIVSVFPSNAAAGRPVVTGLALVLDPATGEPAALVEGAALTAWRTGAASGAATDLLAREDARIGAIIGCGTQGVTQLRAIDAARELDEVRVFARNAESVRAFCDAEAPHVRARLVPAPSATEAVRGADVVCAATTSHVPVLDGADLAEGAHVNGVGSFTLEMREVDERTIERATIYIDELEAALTEAGELVAAEAAGITARDEWTPIGLIARGAAPGRTSPDEITFFKSVGHAVQDVAATARALEAARARGLGTEIEL